MILSGNEIRQRLGTDISIEPFNESQLNPNSYNLRLHNELLTYEEIVLDMRRPNRTTRVEIPPERVRTHAESVVPGAHRRADGDAQSGPDAGRPFVHWTAGCCLCM